VAQSPGFLAQASLNGNVVVTAARAAALAWIALNTDFPALEVAALTPRHACELEGMLTVFMMNSMYRAVKAVGDVWEAEETENRRRVANGQLALPLTAPAAHYLADKFHGGTFKNFFSIMIKTGMHSIVSQLPLPIADMLWRFHARVTAANTQVTRRVITSALHGVLGTAMHNAGMSYDAHAATYFDVNGDYFNRVIGWLGNALHNAGTIDSTTPINGINWAGPSPIGTRAPPAFVWRNAANHADRVVTFVAESRKTRSDLHMAFTEDMFGVVGATPLLATATSQNIVADLNNNIATTPV